jgi:hypothetical protein
MVTSARWVVIHWNTVWPTLIRLNHHTSASVNSTVPALFIADDFVCL